MFAQALWFHHLVDDAFISFRYGRNLVEGNGLVFNPGERVEGYTNFLWVILSSGFVAAGVSPLAGARLLGMAGAIACLGAAWSMARRFEPRTAWLAPAALALHSSLGFWAWGGLETTFYAGLVACALAVHLESRLTRPVEGVLWLAVALTRPDGALFFAVALVSGLLATPGPAGRRARVVLVPAAIAIAGIAAHLLFRRLYYDAWTPNTLHAKTGATAAQVERGLRYLASFVFASGGVLALLPFVAWRADWRWRVLCATCLGYAAYVVAVGGDNMLLHRFLVPILPALMALAAVALAPALTHRLAPALATVVLALLLCRAGDRSLRRDVDRWNASAGDWIRVGLWLRQHEPPSTTIALGAVGAIPYFSRLHAIDVFGLTDAHIAARSVADMGEGFAGHEKGDGAYVMARAPDVILPRVRLYPSPPPEQAMRSLMGETLGEREIRDHPDFDRRYRYETHAVAGGHFGMFRLVAPEANGR